MNAIPRYFALALLLLGQWFLPDLARGQVVNRGEFRHPTDSIQGEERYEKKLHIGGDVDAQVTIDVTAKGNGVLRVLNLSLKVFDECDDGQIYIGGLLHVEFVDLAGTGFKDLVVTGVVVHTGEKETEPRSYEVVTSIYKFDPKKRQFRLTFHCGPKLEY